jgi:hypothetical protein
MSASRWGCAGGGVAHPAITDTAKAAVIEDNRGRRLRNGEGRVGWVFLEIGIALVLAIAIVWWTLPRKPRPPEEKDEP